MTNLETSVHFRMKMYLLASGFFFFFEKLNYSNNSFLFLISHLKSILNETCSNAGMALWWRIHQSIPIAAPTRSRKGLRCLSHGAHEDVRGKSVLREGGPENTAATPSPSTQLYE